MEFLPWAAIGVIGTALLAQWNSLLSTKKDLEDFKVKVAEQYTTNVALDKSINTLVNAINELKVELKETRKEMHSGRGFPFGNQR